MPQGLVPGSTQDILNGIDDLTKVCSPKQILDAINSLIAEIGGGLDEAAVNALIAAAALVKASQAESQAGTDNTKYMTPLRVAEAIAALASQPASNTASFTSTASNLSAGSWVDTGLSITITPSSVTKRIVVTGLLQISGNGGGLLRFIDQDNTVLAPLGDTRGSRTRANMSYSGTSLDMFPQALAGHYVPGVTTQRTIRLQWYLKVAATDMYINRNRTDPDSSNQYTYGSMLHAKEE